MKNREIKGFMPVRIILLTVWLLMGGCASHESIALISDYARQSARAQESLLEVYDSTEQARINSRLIEAVRDGTTINALVPDSIDHSGQRLALAQLLTFSQVIEQIATDNVSQELDQQTEKLNSALTSLTESAGLENTEAKHLQLIATSVNALGRAYTESARYKALKRLMKNSQPIIISTIDRLRKDLPAWKEVTKVSLQNELNLRLYLLNNPNRCVQSQDKRCVSFYHTITGRAQAYRKAYELKQNLDRLDEQFRQLDSALRAISKLNETIVDSLESDNDYTFTAAKKAIRSTKDQLDAIKAFNKNIKG